MPPGFTCARKLRAFSPAVLCALLALPACLPAAAGEDAGPAHRRHWTVSAYLENDLFVDTDRDYTNGTGINFISPDITGYLDDPVLPAWLRAVNQRLTWIHPGGDDLQRNLTVSLAQKIYTPSDFTSDGLAGVRPYSGWLYLGLGYHARGRRHMDSYELDLGIVGPASLARETQDLVHDLRGIRRFQGWDNQLENEPGVQFIFERKLRWLHTAPAGVLPNWDVISHYGVSLGNVATYANTGAALRVGWRVPDDFGTSSLRPGGNNSSPGSDDSRLHERPFGGAHGFLSTDLRLVARDIFLDGNTFAAGPRVDKRHLVGEAAVGFSATFYGIKASLARVIRSREFKGQTRHHSYGSVSLSYTYRF